MNFIKLGSKGLRIESVSALKLAKKYQTPFYCYSLAQLRNNFLKFRDTFKNINPIICFAVKSNSNLTLLKELRRIGAGADVVSAGELLKAKKAGINSKKIVFSGIGKTENEITEAIKKRILLINIESESEAVLVNKISKKLSKKTSVGIRLNPNINVNTHKKILTGTKKEKFGLLYKDCLSLCKKIKKMKNLKLEGLSIHIGSQIKYIKPFRDMLSILNKLIQKTKINFKFIDLGGGIGISYSKKERKLDLKKYASLVKKFTKNKSAKIIFEPGRVIVGDVGILISKIIYIKKSANKKFIVLDVGMNDLMRPALYDAKHQIIPLKKTNGKHTGVVEFVGPICESSDKFLNLNKFAKVKEGDYLALTHVGAYGMSLSSNYNLRPTIAEVLVKDSTYQLIRKRQSLNDLVKN
tara:strand:- start:8964 stop:10193 length:1230 start_codon:yes stop_codon:yes gene_type:complete